MAPQGQLIQAINQIGAVLALLRQGQMMAHLPVLFGKSGYIRSFVAAFTGFQRAEAGFESLPFVLIVGFKQFLLHRPPLSQVAMRTM